MKSFDEKSSFSAWPIEDRLRGPEFFQISSANKKHKPFSSWKISPSCYKELWAYNPCHNTTRICLLPQKGKDPKRPFDAVRRCAHLNLQTHFCSLNLWKEFSKSLDEWQSHSAAIDILQALGSPKRMANNSHHTLEAIVFGLLHTVWLSSYSPM